MLTKCQTAASALDKAPPDQALHEAHRAGIAAEMQRKINLAITRPAMFQIAERFNEGQAGVFARTDGKARIIGGAACAGAGFGDHGAYSAGSRTDTVGRLSRPELPGLTLTVPLSAARVLRKVDSVSARLSGLPRPATSVAAALRRAASLLTRSVTKELQLWPEGFVAAIPSTAGILKAATSTRAFARHSN